MKAHPFAACRKKWSQQTDTVCQLQVVLSEVIF